MAKSFSRSSAALLVAVFLVWLAAWTYGNRGFLFDTSVQADDARTSLIAFHRYEPEHALETDPIAREMMSTVTPSIHLIYRVLTPAFGLFVASKIVQGLCLAILFLAGALILRSPRGGLAPAILLVFLVLHTLPMLQRGVAGGLPRAFAFPLFALWTAGALIASGRLRYIAVVVAALTYPSALVMLLAAEGLYSLRDGVRLRDRDFRLRLARYAVLSVVCIAAMGLFMFAKSDAGHVQTLAEARLDPGFHKGGRIEALPFPNPAKEFTRNFLAPFMDNGDPLIPAAAALWPDSKIRFLNALPYLGLFAALVLLRISPWPRAFLAFALGTTIIYAVARIVAFRLYWPERYYAYGMPMAAVLLAVETVATASFAGQDGSRRTGRNLAALAIIAVLVLFAGTGIDSEHNGMTIDEKEQHDLYAFVRTLPVTSRIASHPMDGDDLPYWTGRPTMGGYETIQPWFVNAWRNEKERAQATLEALYATERGEVLRYCAGNGVTHILLRRGGKLTFWLRSGWIDEGDRYAADFREQARLFEPLGTYVATLLQDRRLEDLVLAQVPSSAVVFRSAEFELIDVARLEKAWAEGAR